MDTQVVRTPIASPAPQEAVAAIPPPPISFRASVAGHENPLDRLAHATIAKLSGGFSPMAVAEAAFDWALHLAASPGRQAALASGALARQAAVAESAWRSLCGAPVGPAPAQAQARDRRFAAAEWRSWPFSFYADSFLAAEQCWDEATSEVHGASPHHLALINFIGRQALDTVAPSNFLPTNPTALNQTVREGGMNLIRGAINFAADLRRLARNERSAAAKAFTPGETVAVTKGAVVARTRLAEILQYEPTTPSARAEPVVIVPAWIMKYYVLDLQPEDSLIKHLVDAGFTVFCISWRNPTSADREIGFDDYGDAVMTAVRAALAITGAHKAHLVGYCIGGTLAATVAAGMARDNDDRLQSLTLIAAQTDFEEAGELRLFIDDSQLALLEDVMWEQGALEANRMAGTFDLMRSNDLIWSRVIHHYLMGEPERMDDLAAWSSDATRMPYRMHSEYLRTLYLNNDLAEGRFKLDGRPVALQDIRAPMFVVGTERDHIAPWRSVFKIHHLSDAEITFALVSAGHNRGIVPPPGQGDRHYRIATTAQQDVRPDPEAWALSARYRRGSWWPAWFDWLGSRSSRLVPPPPLGLASAGFAPLAPAPGDYVRQ